MAHSIAGPQKCALCISLWLHVLKAFQSSEGLNLNDDVSESDLSSEISTVISTWPAFRIVGPERAFGMSFGGFVHIEFRPNSDVTLKDDAPRLERAEYWNTTAAIFEIGSRHTEGKEQLSHCWGHPAQYQPLRLIRENLDTLCEGITYEDLPRTFREAIHLTTTIGVQYLWIDSLCIIQGDIEDWQREGRVMGQIYLNSYCTIAAASSRDGRGGLFRNRWPNMLQQDLVEVDGEQLQLVKADLWSNDLLSAPLHRRAWTLQERLLSPRLLHFTDEQIFWECPSLTACEQFPQGVPRAVLEAAGPEGDMQWRQALHENKLHKEDRWRALDLDAYWNLMRLKYTQYGLTYSQDRLMALAGIAAAVMKQALGGERYVAGLLLRTNPEKLALSDLREQLGWRNLNEHGQRYDTYCAPSWSWASVRGETRDNGTTYRDPEASKDVVFRAEFLEVKIILADPANEFGSVLEGTSLRLQDYMWFLNLGEFTLSAWETKWSHSTKCFVRFDDNRDEACRSTLLHDVTSYGYLYFVLSYSLREPDENGRIWGNRYDGYGMLLKPREEEGFVRIGYLNFYGNDLDDWHACQADFVSDSEDVGSEGYDQANGHIVTIY